jgi:hypothetical protein
MPCIVFAGNVGGNQALLNPHQQDPWGTPYRGPAAKPVTMGSCPGRLRADSGALYSRRSGQAMNLSGVPSVAVCTAGA